jgi:hypothetical protein
MSKIETENFEVYGGIKKDNTFTTDEIKTIEIEKVYKLNENFIFVTKSEITSKDLLLISFQEASEEQGLHFSQKVTTPPPLYIG